MCVCVSLQVIVALSEKSRVHIPYRNSMMTSILRDRYIFVHVHVLYILASTCTMYMYLVFGYSIGINNIIHIM